MLLPVSAGALALALTATLALAEPAPEAAQHALAPAAVPTKTVDRSIFDPSRPLPRYTKDDTDTKTPTGAKAHQAGPPTLISNDTNATDSHDLRR